MPKKKSQKNFLRMSSKFVLCNCIQLTNCTLMIILFTSSNRDDNTYPTHNYPVVPNLCGVGLKPYPQWGRTG